MNEALQSVGASLSPVKPEYIKLRASRWRRHRYGVGEWKIQRSPGIYAIYADGELIYIGQSQNVALRIANHGIHYGYSNNILTPWGSFSRVTIKASYGGRYGVWLMREARLIKRLKPKFNSLLSGNRRSK